MSFLLTSTARLRDWKALTQLNHDSLVGQARDAGAIRYRIYRSVEDASHLLLLAEFPDHDAAREFDDTIIEQLRSLLNGPGADGRMWEPAQMEGIG